MAISLLDIIKETYPTFTFKAGPRFSFRPPKTIFYEPENPDFNSLLLHELGHAILKHFTFTTDIDRLKKERAAWDKATAIAQDLNYSISPDFIENQLDSYRDWLHTKSICKKCGLSRYQTKDGVYHCPYCDNFLKK